MKDSLFMIQGQLDAHLVFKAECTYCYNKTEIETESRREAAKELHSAGWRFAHKVRHEGVVIIGLVCPNCASNMDFTNKVVAKNPDKEQ